MTLGCRFARIMLIQTSMNVSQFWDGLVMGRDPQQATYLLVLGNEYPEIRAVNL